ncbi:unnamed protein product [Sympodiomycopsis kandeliae]
MTSASDDSLSVSVQTTPPFTEAKASLTDEEAKQLEHFLQGRAKIEQDLAVLESRPPINAFADFHAEVDERSIDSIRSVWAALKEQTAECDAWRAERDRIEEQTVQFDSADMESLRKLAKAASERNMSPSDTDLVEVALETLVALEKLRHLLDSRSNSLNVLDARLKWEASREHFYETYSDLADDVDSFVFNKARWSPEVYAAHSNNHHHSATTSSQETATVQSTHGDESARHGKPSQQARHAGKPSKSHFLLGEILSLESQRLLSRINDLRHHSARKSEESLDAMISLLKIPDEFLDEQDRVDRLVDDLDGRASFIKDLTLQWQRADQLYHSLLAIHVDARSLLSRIEETKQAVPDAADVADSASKLRAIRHRLEEVSDLSVHTYLSNPSQRFLKLRFNTTHAVQLPTHSHWPDQERFNATVDSVLSKELATTTRRVRQATEVIEAFQKRLQAHRRLEDLQFQITSKTTDCQQIASDLRFAISVEADKSTAGESSAKAQAWQNLLQQLNDFALRSPGAECSRTLALDRLIDSCKVSRQSLFKLQREASTLAGELRDQALLCESLGITPEYFKDSVALIVQTWTRNQAETMEGIDAVTQLVTMLRRLLLLQRQLDEALQCVQISEKHALDSVMTNHWANARKHDGFSLAARAEQSSWRPTASLESFVADHMLAKNGLEVLHKDVSVFLQEVQAGQHYFNTKAEILSAAEQRLADRLKHVEQNHAYMSEVVSWAQSLAEQTKAVARTHTEYCRLRETCDDKCERIRQIDSEIQAMEVYLTGPEVDESRSIAEFAGRLDALNADLPELWKLMENFICGQDTLPFVGATPSSIKHLAAFQEHLDFFEESSDTAVRSHSHDMSLELNKIKERLAKAMRSCVTRAQALQQKREAHETESSVGEEERAKSSKPSPEVDAQNDRQEVEHQSTALRTTSSPELGDDATSGIASSVPNAEHTKQADHETFTALNSERTSEGVEQDEHVDEPKGVADTLSRSNSATSIVEHRLTEENPTKFASNRMPYGHNDDSASCENFSSPATNQLFPHSSIISRAVTACEQELIRRDKSFNKILNSATSRRLPKSAFLAELRHRRIDADSALQARLTALQMVIEHPDTTLSNDHMSTSDIGVPRGVSGHQEHERLSKRVAALLASFDAAIEAEGGKLPAAPRSAEKPGRKSLAFPTSLSVDMSTLLGTPRRRSAVEFPLSSSFPILPHDAGNDSRANANGRARDAEESERLLNAQIERLRARLLPGEVEEQTVPPDGSRQSRDFVELPSFIRAEQLSNDHREISQDISVLTKQHPNHPDLTELHATCRSRAERILRVSCLAEFAVRAVSGEKAVSAFLQTLDDVSGATFARDSMSPSPSPSPGATRSMTPRQTPQSRPSSRLGALDGTLLQGRAGSSRANHQLHYAGHPSDDEKTRIEAQLRDLEKIIEEASYAASLVMDDVRVRTRLAQLNASFVDVSEMSCDVTDPATKRSLSVMSRSTTDSYLSRASSPALSNVGTSDANEPTEVMESVDYSNRRVIRPRQSSVTSRVASSKSTPGERRRRTSSSAAIGPPSATAQRALMRSAAAAAAASSSSSSSSSSPAQTPGRPAKAAYNLRRSSLNTPAGTANPETPLRSRVPLPVIRQSPKTPSQLGFSEVPKSQSLSQIRTPTSLARAPGSRLPLRSPSIRSTRSVSGQSAVSLEATRRPNRYRANPKSKLDVAVGKIVNKMPVPVQIVHASKAPGARATDDWRDESGRYWVGHPDPKLCFCRILRSRTIMVRVGGGWQELTRYVYSHYNLAASVAVGDSSSPTRVKSSPTSSQRNTSNLPWISAASLQQQQIQLAQEEGREAAMMTPSRSYVGGRRLVSTSSSQGQDISSPILFSTGVSPEAVRLQTIQYTPSKQSASRHRERLSQSPTFHRPLTPLGTVSSTRRARMDSTSSVIDYEATPTRPTASSYRQGRTLDHSATLTSPSVSSDLLMSSLSTTDQSQDTAFGRTSADASSPQCVGLRLVGRKGPTFPAVQTAAEDRQDNIGQMLPLYFRKEDSPEAARARVARRSISGAGDGSNNYGGIGASASSRRRVSQGGASNQ